MSTPNSFTFRNFYIPADQTANTTFIVRAIGKVVPSGQLSSEWTDAVIEKLRYEGVRAGVIVYVLEKARDTGGHDFARPSAQLNSRLMYDPEWVAATQKWYIPPPPPIHSHPTVNPRPADGDRLTYMGRLNAVSILEKQFRDAEANADFAGMDAALAAALVIIWETIKAYGRARQMKGQANEKMVEWEEFQEAVRTALAEAHSLRSHLRQISPSELAEMRRMPRPSLPSGMRIRLQSQVRNPRRPARRK